MYGPSTSMLFTSHIVQLKTIYRKARLSLRKQLRNDEATGAEDENEVVEQEAQDERIDNTSCIEDEVVPIMFVTDAETFENRIIFFSVVLFTKVVLYLEIQSYTVESSFLHSL